MFRPQHGGNLSWAAAQAGCLPTEILDFSASINPLGPPQSVLKAIRQHLDEISSYPDPASTILRQALSQLHQVPMDWILVGNGAAELLTWACRSLSELKQVHLVTPAFSDYGRALRAFGAKILTHNLNLPIDLPSRSVALWADLSEDFLLRSLAAFLSDPSFDAQEASASGLLLNNPHNPTGQIATKADLLPLLDCFSQVVVDEAFMEFLPQEDAYSLVGEIEAHPNLVVLRSLTKFYSIPGLRLGYAIAHPDRLAQWQQWRDPWSVNVLAMQAGVAGLQDIAFQGATYDWLAAAKPQLQAGLAALSGLTPLPSAANFFLVHCDASVLALQKALLQQRLLIRDCMSFAELGDRYFRVAVRTEAENVRLLQALADKLSDPLLSLSRPNLT
ncbi:MAG: threonine-phosphate decarboxylase CobD [Thermosynechococcaceae cyanobacterium MS004]|nr:threonine-phosphate decarboxylase CobD [Thermosynechococcaceae cyanobacterium MS004]